MVLILGSASLSFSCHPSLVQRFLLESSDKTQFRRRKPPAMNHSQLQTLFDSVCRCFGHVDGPHGPTSSGIGQTPSSHSPASPADPETVEEEHPTAVNATNSQVGRRRTNRLGLQDQQWDELFEKKKSTRKVAVTVPPESNDGEPAATDLNTAQALAQAKLAANPPRYNRTKRKRSSKAREEIFRSKDIANDARSSHAAAAARNAANATTFTRLLHPSLAMCFATPVRGTEEAPDEMDMRSVDNSDANTLNTCEDTITSTVYYENKLAHMTESRPPMPLFNQFKIGSSKDEIQNIVASDSHSSVNMIRLMQQHQQLQNQQTLNQPTNGTSTPVAVEPDTSSEEGQQGHRNKTQRTGVVGGNDVVMLRSPHGQQTAPPHQTPDEEMEDVVPDVKAVSDSSGSDASMRHHQAPRSRPLRRQVYDV